jgi:hypothetical protein
MVAISASVRLGSLANVPADLSANHGGIWRDPTFSLIARAYGRASW